MGYSDKIICDFFVWQDFLHKFISNQNDNNMEYVVGSVIIFLFAVCFYGIIDTIRQLNK